MKKISNKIIITFFIFAIICSSLVFNTSADNAVIDLGGKKNVTVGDSVNVKITVTGSYLTGTDIDITYNPDVLEYVSGGDDGGAGLIQIVDYKLTEGSKSVTYKLVFAAKKAGSSSVVVEGVKSDGKPAEDVEVSASAKINVNDPVLSSNAKLKSLSVSEGTLSPKFSASTTSYSVKVKNSVTECTVSAKAADSDAKISVSKSNPIKLKVGNNTCKITVTAPNGSEKTYSVVIVRSEKSDESSKSESSKVESSKPDSSETQSSSTQSETSSDSESSSQDSSSDAEDETPSNPLQTTIDGTEFIVATDISSVKLFAGFKAVETEFNGETVSVAEDDAGVYKIYYLGSSKGGDLAPYTYDPESGLFHKVAFINQENHTYIISDFPDNTKASDGFYVTNAKIADFDVRCYTSSSPVLSDFYYLYCFNGEGYAVYRYDSLENILQRSPDFVLTEENILPSYDDDSSSETVDQNADNFISRFNSLSSNAKIIIVSLGLLALGVIALIILLLIKLFKGKNSFDDDPQDYNEDLDSFEFNDNSNDISEK